MDTGTEQSLHISNLSSQFVASWSQFVKQSQKDAEGEAGAETRSGEGAEPGAREGEGSGEDPWAGEGAEPGEREGAGGDPRAGEEARAGQQE